MILNNAEIERAVIASTIWNSDIYDIVFEKLSEQHFYEPKYRNIFNVAKYAYDEDGRVDPITVDAIIQNDNKFKVERGEINSMMGQGSSLSNIDQHIDILESFAIKRKCQEEVAKVLSNADGMDGFEMADKLSAIAGEIELGIPTQHTFTPDEIIEREFSKPKVEKLETGEYKLDEIVYKNAGLARGHLEITLADSGHGKTQYAMYKVALLAKNGYKVLWFQLEDYDFNTAVYFKNRIGDFSKNIFICDSLSDIEDIRKETKAIKREHGLDYVVVDYVQSVGCDKRQKNDQVEYISSQFTKMAKKLNVVVHLLSQVTIKYDLRKGWKQEPRLGDVRWSQQLKQDAHMITGLFRPAVVDGLMAREGFALDWDNNEIPDNTVYVRQLKDRYGAIDYRRLKLTHIETGLEVYSDRFDPRYKEPF
jgi:replicative DNA helicase